MPVCINYAPKLIPVMLAKETSIHLAIFVPKSLGRPEWKSFQFGPDQRVRVTLQKEKTNARIKI